MKCELAAESLRASGRLRLQVIGWSMMPTIRPGDILEIEHVSSAFVSAGEIVLFARDGRLCAHRVVATLPSCDGNHSFITQGDAMVESDPPFSSSSLLGRVCLISRNKNNIYPTALSLRQRTVSSILRRSVVASRLLARLHAVRQLGVAACRQ